jgi:hypothetical protein
MVTFFTRLRQPAAAQLIALAFGLLVFAAALTLLAWSGGHDPEELVGPFRWALLSRHSA